MYVLSRVNGWETHGCISFWSLRPIFRSCLEGAILEAEILGGIHVTFYMHVCATKLS